MRSARPFLVFCLALVAAAIPARAGSEIPFSFSDGFILLKARARGTSEPLNLLLDSGASNSVLSLEAARRLGAVFRGQEAVRGVSAECQAWRINPLRLAAQDVALPAMDMAIDLTNAQSLCQQPVDGLLGADFLARHIVQIDFVAHRVRLLDARVARGAGIHLALKAQNGIYCVPIALNGSDLRLTRLDTGCNDSLHWVLPRANAPRPSRQASIGFITDPADATLGKVQVGSESLFPVEVSLHTEPMFPGEAGLLGIGILSRYLVTIDCVHKELVLQPGER